MTDPLAVDAEPAGFGALILLIAWTWRYLLAMRERRIRELQQGQSA